MPDQKTPKGLLFDIGGVCVLSPFQAILDYEKDHGIPSGWINYAISRTAPNGHWHRLERGEIKMDADFFSGFNADLCDEALWKQYHTGGPGSKSNTRSDLPPLPSIDAEVLFWNMMRASRETDPYVFPALKKLRASNKFVIGALSNTVIFPPDHEYNTDRSDVRSQFDVFISSAHVGLRKPDPKIYRLAVKELDSISRKKGREGLEAGDIVFLDDIGQNLKAATGVGMQTIKVQLGKTWEAVKELEQLTGLELSDSDTRKAKL